jgi:hypothetical protein
MTRDRRWRTVLYLLTSNRDGRTTPRPGDDRIIRVVPPG